MKNVTPEQVRSAKFSWTGDSNNSTLELKSLNKTARDVIDPLTFPSLGGASPRGTRSQFKQSFFRLELPSRIAPNRTNHIENADKLINRIDRRKKMSTQNGTYSKNKS